MSPSNEAHLEWLLNLAASLPPNTTIDRPYSALFFLLPIYTLPPDLGNNPALQVL